MSRETVVVPFFDFSILSRPGGCNLCVCSTIAPCVVVGDIAGEYFEEEHERTHIYSLPALVVSGSLWLAPLFGFLLNIPPVLLTPIMVVPSLATGVLNHAVLRHAGIPGVGGDCMSISLSALKGVVYPCTICQARSTQHENGSDLINHSELKGATWMGRKARIVAPRQMVM